MKAINVILNEGLIENVGLLTPKFEAGLAELAKNPNIGEARSKGLMGALEAVKDKDTKTPFGPEANVSEKIANTCSDFGLICRPLGQAIVLCPAFIMTDTQMEEMFDKLSKALNKVFAEVS